MSNEEYSEKMNKIEQINSMQPTTLSPVEVYNMMQDTEPVAKLAGVKFHITGLFAENVEVGDNDENKSFEEMVANDGQKNIRTRTVLFTDKGAFHSFSISIEKNILRLISLFGKDFLLNTYELTSKTQDKKVFYTLKIVK